MSTLTTLGVVHTALSLVAIAAGRSRTAAADSLVRTA